MTVRAIHNNYQFEPLDLQKNYGDQFLLYVGWDHHTLFCSAHAMLASPQQTFGQLIEQKITGGFAQHPDFAKIDWSKVQYTLMVKQLVLKVQKLWQSLVLGISHYFVSLRQS